MSSGCCLMEDASHVQVLSDFAESAQLRKLHVDLRNHMTQLHTGRHDHGDFMRPCV